MLHLALIVLLYITIAYIRNVVTFYKYSNRRIQETWSRVSYVHLKLWDFSILFVQACKFRKDTNHQTMKLLFVALVIAGYLGHCEAAGR
jgi:hypothetical protein